jgi:hypothetical protein
MMDEKYFEKMFFKIQDNMDCIADWKNVETLLKQIFLDGRREQARLDREVVGEVDQFIGSPGNVCQFSEIIAALEAARGGE